MEINKVTLLGRIGNIDVKDKYTRFSVATNKNKKKGDEWEKITHWHNCVVFGKTADYFNEKAVKGSLAHVEGELSYNTKDEVKYTNILVNSVKTEKPFQKSEAPKKEAAKDDDDLPF